MSSLSINPSATSEEVAVEGRNTRELNMQLHLSNRMPPRARLCVSGAHREACHNHELQMEYVCTVYVYMYVCMYICVYVCMYVYRDRDAPMTLVVTCTWSLLGDSDSLAPG